MTGDGFSTGTISYNQGVAYNNWRSKYKHFCVTPSAPPAPPPAPVCASNTAFAGIPGTDQDGDVDVYNAPGGTGNVIGVLQKDNGVQVNADCKPNDWCLVRDVAVPTGQG